MSERRGDWMQTYTGRKFWPFDPRVEDVSMLDVAHHLANTCRYSGAVLRFYSVAQHSVLMSHLVESVDPSLGPHALLHDAHEAYHGDRIRPIKRGLAMLSPILARRLTKAEERTQVCIEARVGLKLIDEDAHATIAHADLVALATERRDLMRPTGEPWVTDGVPPWIHTIEPLLPDAAEDMFLARFVELFPGFRP